MNIVKKKEQQLKNYVWGFGLEHEMHIFHKPKVSKKKNIKDFILFDSESARFRLIRELNKDRVSITGDEWDYISTVPYEQTGRKCNGKWVIKKVPFNMPEFITDEPINRIKRDRDINTMCQEVINNKDIYIKCLMKDPITKKQVKKYGELVQLPVGMTSYLKYPENPNNVTYRFKKSGKNDTVRQEYVGSYHITVTLPYIQSQITKKKFIDNHKNFANQLQWLEPLLLTSFFSCDQKAAGSDKKRVRGSFRVMIIGWGNFAGSDVRKLGKGIGRYANIPTYWRKNMKFHDLYKLEPCYKPSPSAIREHGISTLSSNFRTFGSTDPERPQHRESGAGMTIGNGVEFRIFDHFPDEYLDELCKFVSFVAENSRVHKSNKYVYQNKHWKDALHNIMEHGWCAELKKDYINELRKILGLKINTKSFIAFDVLNCINNELFTKHKNGDYVILMNS